MAGKRLFAAIALPPDLAGEIAAEERRLAGGLRGGRWTAEADLHITVCFFGDVEEEDVPALTRVLTAAVSSVPAPQFLFDGFTAAPPGSRRQSMIWAVFDGGEEYAELVRAVRTAAGPFALDMPQEKEAIAHVTMARFRDGLAARPPFGKAAPAPFRAATCDLMESRLTPAGPVYSVLARMDLRR